MEKFVENPLTDDWQTIEPIISAFNFPQKWKAIYDEDGSVKKFKYASETFFIEICPHEKWIFAGEQKTLKCFFNVLFTEFNAEDFMKRLESELEFQK